MNDDCARFLEEFERLEKQMPANDPDQLKRFVGAIDNLFAAKAPPSPPFRISGYAVGWMRDRISRPLRSRSASFSTCRSINIGGGPATT
jgi:hypothetical protein